MLRLAATDVSDHLACHHLTTLELLASLGEQPAPGYRDPRVALLHQRGREHEERYLDHLRAAGLEVLRLPPADTDAAALAATRAAMVRGVDVIAQAPLGDEHWFGVPDVLRRVERASGLGSWSYEPHDTKLARTTRGDAIVQLCVYADLLAGFQGLTPDWIHVVVPGRGFVPESFRAAEYLAYYRRVRSSLAAVVATPAIARTSYPDPVAHCDVCRWWVECNRRWHTDDHLSLVADLRRSQAKELMSWGVSTLRALAALTLPLQQRPRRGSPVAFVRLREQARLQLASRGRETPTWELLPLADRQGLARLPEPSHGDVFLDFEADRYWGDAGLEYLFGLVTLASDGELCYSARWATDRAQDGTPLSRSWTSSWRGVNNGRTCTSTTSGTTRRQP